MTPRTRITTTLTAVAAALLLAACGAGGDDGGNGDDRAKQAAETARAYQKAVLAQDWQTVCETKTERMRGGTVAACVDLNSTAPDREDDTTKVGPVTTSDTIEVDATGDHPAGIGVLVSYKVTHVGWQPETDQQAVRVVADGDTWRVDQALTLDGDHNGADEVRAALQER